MLHRLSKNNRILMLPLKLAEADKPQRSPRAPRQV